MDLDRARLLGKVARLYYEQDMTQEEISRRLRLSRQKVQRLLSNAREEGVVNIAIHPIMGTFTEMERALEANFGLSEALVIETSSPDSQSAIAREVGSGAAEYMTRMLRPKDKVVLSWGNSLLGMVNALASRARPRMPDLLIIQALGSLGDPNTIMYGGELIRRAAKAFCAKAVLFPAPAIAASAAVRDALYADPYVAHSLDLARTADLAFVGIGSSDSDSVALPDLYRFLPQETLPDLMSRGAVGSINLRYFDAAGEMISSELDDRIIGLALADMKKISRVVGVAGGPSKLKAIHAVLKAGFLDVLVTDHVTAGELLSKFSNEIS